MYGKAELKNITSKVMKVYCVFIDYNYEGKELEEIFLNEADADAYIENHKSYWHLLVKEIWEVK